MAGRVKWGILSTAKIGVEKVIPAMQKGDFSEVVAISSRDAEKARSTADRLGIPRAFGSYDELLGDPEVEAIYNPLPNHLHVPWSIRAAEAGKHVLCEKPIGLSSEEARDLIRARDRTGVKMQEAFMVRTHPQWLGAARRIRDGLIGPADCHPVRVQLFQPGFREHSKSLGHWRRRGADGHRVLSHYHLALRFR